MAHWTKGHLLKILAEERIFEFVDSEKESDEYFELKKFGIIKDSIELKELINEGHFPVNNQILNLEKGYYYIIDIVSQESEFKSQTKTTNIAYALYRENKSASYGDQVYQINVNTLINGTSKPIFDNESFNRGSDLVGKTINIRSIKEGCENVKSRQIGFTGINVLTTPEELERINVPPTEEDILHEGYVMDMIEEDAKEKAMYESPYDVFDFIEEDPSMYFD